MQFYLQAFLLNSYLHASTRNCVSTSTLCVHLKLKSYIFFFFCWTIQHESACSPPPPKYWPRSVLFDFWCSKGNQVYRLVHYRTVHNSSLILAATNFRKQSLKFLLFVFIFRTYLIQYRMPIFILEAFFSVIQWIIWKTRKCRLYWQHISWNWKIWFYYGNVSFICVTIVKCFIRKYFVFFFIPEIWWWFRIFDFYFL